MAYSQFFIQWSSSFICQLLYRISVNSFCGNYSFLNLTLSTVTFDYTTYRCGNYSRAETIWGNTVSIHGQSSIIFIKTLNKFTSPKPCLLKWMWNIRRACDIYNVNDNYKYRGYKLKEITATSNKIFSLNLGCSRQKCLI